MRQSGDEEKWTSFSQLLHTFTAFFLRYSTVGNKFSSFDWLLFVGFVGNLYMYNKWKKIRKKSRNYVVFGCLFIHVTGN